MYGLSDRELEELEARLPELTAGGGLEALDGLNVDELKKANEEISDGSFNGPRGLEAIIKRFGRPAYFVRKDAIDIRATDDASTESNERTEAAAATLEVQIPRIGRIDLRNARKNWVGTGWIVAPGVVVTNRHVALDFAHAEDGGYAFDARFDGKIAKAELDLKQEYDIPDESRFKMPKVLWIASKSQPDVAFLAIDDEGEDRQPLPAPVPLMADADFEKLAAAHWLAVVGYPAHDSRNNRHDQQRIFRGVFNVKRCQPGQVKAIRGTEGILQHDATTLGGSSGSAVLDMTTGRAVALHFGGDEDESNYAVTAPVIRHLLKQNLPDLPGV